MADLLRGSLLGMWLGLSLGLQPYFPPPAPGEVGGFGHGIPGPSQPTTLRPALPPPSPLSPGQVCVHLVPLPMTFPLQEYPPCSVDLACSSSDVPSLGSWPLSQGRISHILPVMAHTAQYCSHWLLLFDSKTRRRSHCYFPKMRKVLTFVLLINLEVFLKLCDWAVKVFCKQCYLRIQGIQDFFFPFQTELTHDHVSLDPD